MSTGMSQMGSEEEESARTTSPMRTVNPVLAMQGIVKFAVSIPSAPAEALAELEAADEVLRFDSALSRAEAFGSAEAAVRRALARVEECCRAAEVEDGDEQISWLRSVVARTMSGRTVPQVEVDKPALDRLAGLLRTLLDRWPRDAKRCTAADRASRLVRVASTEDAPGLVNGHCAVFIGACAAAVLDSAACAVLGAALGKEEATKKRKRRMEQHGSSSSSSSSGGEKQATSSGETESTRMIRVKSEQSDLCCEADAEDAEVDAVVATARHDLTAANAVAGADAIRASRSYRAAASRLETLRASTSDRQRLRCGRAVVDMLRRASSRARATGHVVENAVVERVEPAAWSRPRRQREDYSLIVERQGVVIAKKKKELAPDLFTDDEGDDLSPPENYFQRLCSVGSSSSRFDSVETTATCCVAPCLPTSFEAARRYDGLESRTLQRPESLEALYELGETLGKGSYGVVRVAVRKTDGAWFACKSLTLELSEASLDRLHSEIAAMRKLDHPNICRVHDVFYAKKVAHLVLDLCTGGELWTRVFRREKPVPEAVAARWTRDMVSAVRYMHDAGVCHRDLKPQNWLFASRDEDAPLKLVDFGLAKHFCERPKPRRRRARRRSDAMTDDEHALLSSSSSSDEDESDALSVVSDAMMTTNPHHFRAGCCATLFTEQHREFVFGAPEAPDLRHPAEAETAKPFFDEDAFLPKGCTKAPVETPQIDTTDRHDEDVPLLPQMSTLDDVAAAHPVAAAARLFAANPEEDDDEAPSGDLPQPVSQFWVPPAVLEDRRREVARLAAASARRTKRGYLSDRVGSFYFVAPEVLRGAHDARCDLWSLGVIVYMLLSGVPPFGGRTDREILARVARAKLAFPERLFGHVSPAARLFVARLLDRDVDRRLTADRAAREEWLETHAPLPRPDPAVSARLAASARRFARLDALAKLAVVVVALRLPLDGALADIARDFAAFDRDADGRLSLAEFFAALGGSLDGGADGLVSVEEAAALFDAADVKGDGRAVSFREFVAAALCGRLAITEAHLRDAFDALDVQAAGALTPVSLRNFVGLDRCVGPDDNDPSALLEQHLHTHLHFHHFAHHLLHNPNLALHHPDDPDFLFNGHRASSSSSL